jgi:hypothetical protein
MKHRGFISILAIAFLCSLPGPALSDDSKAHDQYLQVDDLFEMDKPDAAIAAYRMAVSAKPDPVDAHFNMAFL